MLEVKDVAVSYGRHRALEGVSLRVEKGEICVILGANGAGKSTLLKTIAGMVPAEAGSEIVMNGKTITTMKAHKIVEEGIALVPEGRGIFGDLTVAENLQLGAFANRARSHEAETLALIYRLFPKLAERKRQVARTMSGGEQQMVAIGRALMSRPDILMLDEPSLGLSPLLSKELFKSLAEVAKTGVGILLVEQNAKQSLKISRRGYLIENGHVTGENTAEALMTDPAVVSAYLGGGGTAAPKPEAAGPRFVLPSFLRLPLDLAGMSRSLAGFAARAGSIQAAFVRALRREQNLPSAFVGRYDPKAGPDPWDELAATTPVSARPAISDDARRLSGSAALLSQRAGERLAAHIASTRMSRQAPSFAAMTPHVVEVSPARAQEPELPAPVEAEERPAHGLMGHNSAGIELDDAAMVAVEVPQPAEVSQPQLASGVRPASPGMSIADMAARAAAIQAAHVARNRKPAAETVAPAPVEQAATPARDEGISFADLAARAATIQAAHVARSRKAVSVPVDVWTPEVKAVKPANAAISDLVARATAVHSAHVAEQRKRLTAHMIPIQPSGKADTKDTAKKKKRKKHKEA